MRCLSCFYDCFRRNNTDVSTTANSSTDNLSTAASSSVAEASSVINSTPSSQTKGKVTDSYTLGKVIGSGSYSVVRESVHMKSKRKFAIKCIKRSELSTDDDAAIQFEVSILKQMKHPHIMTLEEFFIEPEYYYLVTEFVSGDSH
ncbi:camk camk1 protein kinase [Plasmopara halstedii]|uniref:non-specific serine/threonine protein kinase n=1 Tax=Plasmopara halstedii TaxID=4781 RepID=A0A0P1B6C2_PLAHL|nr:camk camk1 protein kinase [Plasmopara halstedii]CEG49604.1 camk camk1 protein kinase [Plasmopara halstedii]|eukprot:XP_024585973.1 camk camk1 protein kinase [Plasmopara halstedii]